MYGDDDLSSILHYNRDCYTLLNWTSAITGFQAFDWLFRWGQDRMFQLGQGRMFQLGQDRMFQLGQDRMFQLGQDRMFQVAEVGQDIMFQVGQDRMFQVGQYRMFQVGQYRMLQVGQNKMSQVLIQYFLMKWTVMNINGPKTRSFYMNWCFENLRLEYKVSVQNEPIYGKCSKWANIW